MFIEPIWIPFLMKLPTLKNWAVFHDALVGEAYYHPEFTNGQRVVTNHCNKLDTKLKVATCVDEVWILGESGNIEDYTRAKKKQFLDVFYEETKDKISDITKKRLKF